MTQLQLAQTQQGSRTVMWACHYGMMIHLWIVDGGDSILNEQLWTADKWCSSSFVVGQGANNS